MRDLKRAFQLARHNYGGWKILQQFVYQNPSYLLDYMKAYRDSTHVALMIDFAVDARRRYTQRDFSATSETGSQRDMVFLYDDLDRVTCRRDSSGSTCPSTGYRESFGYNDSNDRSSFVLTNSAYPTATTFTAKYVSNTDKVDCLLQGGTGTACNSNPSGYIIGYAYDSRGNRVRDESDELSGALDDQRDYTYDARNNLLTVTGKYWVATNDLNRIS